MIHTSVIADPGHVLVLFLSCTYGTRGGDLDSDEAKTRSKRTKEQVQAKNRNKYKPRTEKHVSWSWLLSVVEAMQRDYDMCNHRLKNIFKEWVSHTCHSYHLISCDVFAFARSATFAEINRRVSDSACSPRFLEQTQKVLKAKWFYPQRSLLHTSHRQSCNVAGIPRVSDQ